MSSSPSEHEFHCPECGALLSAGADQCWKCRRDFVEIDSGAASPAMPASEAAQGGGGSGYPPLEGHKNYQSSSARDPVFAALMALVVAGLTAVAASVAFFGTCLGAMYVTGGLGEAITAGLLSGSIAAIAVVAFFVRRARKNRQLRRQASRMST